MVNRQQKNKSIVLNPIFKEQSVVMNMVDLNQDLKVDFPRDMLTNILSRLPVRSLLRFKCVSKFWETLIDEPYFRRKHLNYVKNDQSYQKVLFYQLQPEKGLFSIYCGSLSSVQLVEVVREVVCPLNFEPRNCKVYCYCDGLFGIGIHKDIVERHILLLWNPSTGESNVLPALEFQVEEFSCLGLSSDSTSGDYKILKIAENKNDGGKVPGEILTLKADSWRKNEANPYVIYNIVSSMHSLALIHGAFHWIGLSRIYFVVSFNMSHEVYGEIPLPEQICLMNSVNVGISVMEGMLSAYSNVYHEVNRTFNLWVMKDYGLKESWSLVFTMVDPDIRIPVPKYRFEDDEEVLFWCLYLRCGNIAFRVRRGSFTLLPRGAAQNEFAFTESLISPRLLT